MEISELTTDIDENTAAQPHKVFLPGCFVVLQGIAGDGLANTVDSCPDFSYPDEHDIDDEDDGEPTQEEEEEEEEEAVGEVVEDGPREFPHYLEEDHFRPNNETSSSSPSPSAAAPTLLPTGSTSTFSPSLLLSQLMVSNQSPTCALNNPSSLIHHRGGPTRSTPPRPLQTVSEVHSEGTPPPRRPTTTRNSPPDDSFVVVNSDDEGNASPTAQEPLRLPNTAATTTTQGRREERRRVQSIQQWREDLLQNQRLQRQEWEVQQQQHHHPRRSSSLSSTTSSLSSPSGSSHHNHHSMDWWLNPQNGHLAVFDGLPAATGSSQKEKKIGSLPPGSTVTAYKLYTLDSETLQFIQVDEEGSNDDNPPIPPSIGIVQMLEIEWNKSTTRSSSSSSASTSSSSLDDSNLILDQPSVGYCVYSVHGYSFLVPGIPTLYMDPQVWWWRVTCKVGAFLRQGLELSSDHLCTIPYGSFVQVTRKTVNRMGLSRLRVVAEIENQRVEGWCSEFLNPLSGQRGHVVQPIPFAMPALYRVTLPEGALIRQGVELSSRQIGHAPFGTILTIVGRQFSEHPQDQCVERLKLAGGDETGWISVRLNQVPPQDRCVVELVGVDTRFNPHQPGNFHWQVFDKERMLERQQQIVEQQQQQQLDPSNPNGADCVSSIEECSSSEEKSRTNTTKTKIKTGQSQSKRKQQMDPCMICLTEERNATIVHGETGHIACCLVCARILKARGDRCPVCRLEISSVIQHFWA